MLKPGDRCTVNRSNDIGVIAEAKPFIGRECIFVKITKAGLYNVSLKHDMKKNRSFPKYNIDKVEP